MIGAQAILQTALVVPFIGAAGTLFMKDRKAMAAWSFGTALIFASLLLPLSISVLLGDGIGFDLLVDGPFGTYSLRMDALAAFFVMTIAILVIAVSIYSIGYVAHLPEEYDLRRMGALFDLFIASMVLVVLASNVVLFLVVWELMSLTSYFLVMTEHRDPATVRAGGLYVTMTHLGTAAIAAGLLLMASETGTFAFQGGAVSNDLIFALLLLGFGTKAGMVPLHLWLPYAHPAAPSNISALMSGVMVKTAIYMLLRSSFELLGANQPWWGLLVLSLGSITALVGVLYALIEADLKRMLAFSTVENVGIMLIVLGAAMVFSSYGLDELAALAIVALLLHVLFHAMFKGLLFMGAGAVQNATNSRRLDSLGGLVKRMPKSSALFFVGVLAILGVPPLNGFVSEWMAFQSLFRSFSIPEGGAMVRILMPLSLAALALTVALASAAFVRVFGVAFLGRPRSREADEAVDPPRSMLFAMSMLAVLCLLTGLLSPWLLQLPADVAASLVGAEPSFVSGPNIVTAPGSETSPLLIGMALAAVVLLLVTFGRRKARKAPTWDCGTPLTSRQQYTSVGFAQPLERMFKTIYRTRTDVIVTSTRTVHERSVLAIFERYVYAPPVRGVRWMASRIALIQSGSVQAYLAYILGTLIVLMVLFR